MTTLTNFIPSTLQGSPRAPENYFRPPRHQRYGNPTTAISSRQAKAYERAVGRAQVLDLNFAFVTITWDLTSRAAQADRGSVLWLRELARKWLRHRQVQFYDLGVREIGHIKGPHWHWLIHCPAHLRNEFDAYLRGQLTPSGKGAVQIRKPPRMADCEGCGRPRDWQHLARCYFLKGSTDTVRDRNGINACASASKNAEETYAKHQGRITGKRLWHSRSLGDKAHTPTRTSQKIACEGFGEVTPRHPRGPVRRLGLTSQLK